MPTEENNKSTLPEEPAASEKKMQAESPAVIPAENESAAPDATDIVEQENKPIEEGQDQNEKIIDKPTITEKEVETNKRSLEDVDKNADPLAKKAKTEGVPSTEKKLDVEK